MNEPTLSVVIPAFNESKRIGGTLREVLDFLKTRPFSWEVLVVDDGSTDDTAALVEGFAQESAGAIRLVRVPHGGKGWAVRHGMLAALGQFRFLCDADLSMPISEVERFLPPQCQDYDIAIGSREAPGAKRIGEPAYRHLWGRLFNLLVRLLAVPGISDSQCGFKSFRSPVAERLFSVQRLRGFSFDAEVLFLARKMGLRVVEVPIDWYFRQESRVRMLRDGPRMVRDLVLVRWWHLSRQYQDS